MSHQESAVRSEVASCFSAILGHDQQARKLAEEELNTLEVTEEFGLVLAEMTAAQDTPVQYRQLASIILKQYIEGHWSRLSQKFREPEIEEKVKVSIRKVLPSCLGDGQSRIRAAVAYAISAIAHWDWPENWSDLFDLLMASLESCDCNLVHGTMRVLSEFCQEISDAQVPHVANAVLPHLLKVISKVDLYSVRTRMRAVHIYNILSGLIFTITMTFPDAAKIVLFPSLGHYITTFVEILSSTLPSNTDHGLRKEVIMTLCHLLRSFTQTLTPYIMMVVTPIWNMLTQGATMYLNTVVNSELLSDEVCDSDGEVIGQESSIFAMFEFINVLGESSHFQDLLPPILPQLAYLLIVHMQITQEQTSAWMESVNQFVDEDENELAYSIRLSAFDLLQSFLEEPKLAAPCYSAIVAAINKHLEETPASSGPHWWKVHEACMLSCDVLVEGIRNEDIKFDMNNFMNDIVLADISDNGCPPLLSGRCLWLAGKMSSFLSPPILLKFMQVIADALRPSQPPVLRILTAKAVYYFCSELKSTEHAQLLQPWLADYLNSLCQLASESPEDVVFLVVDSLQLVTRMDMLVTAQCSSVVVPLAMSLFIQYSHDPGISSCVEELFQALSFNPGSHQVLHSHVLPTALEILDSLSPHLPLGLVTGVLDVLVHVVRGCGAEGSAGVPQAFIQQIFPRVVKTILGSSDSAVLQNGGECIRSFVSSSVEHVASWVDEEGRNGLHYVLQTILHLLDPLVSEFSASFVGKLIIVFVKKAGGVLGPDLELVLRAVLSKMQSVTTPSVMQSLLLVFARLIQTEMENVVSFLSHVPDASGKPALNYILSEWCSRHSFFFGMYETKVSTLAFCQLLSHCISTGDKRLSEITLPGEEIIPEGQGVRTRSQREAAPTKWTEVTLPVKILKLLLSDLQHKVECMAEVEESVYSEDEDGGGIEMTLERLLATAATTSTGGGGAREQLWEVEEDPDLQDDPLMQLDIQDHLVKYIHELSQLSCFSSFSSYLTQSEHKTLAMTQQIYT